MLSGEWHGLDALDNYQFSGFFKLPPDIYKTPDQIIGEPKEKAEISKRILLEEGRIRDLQYLW